MVFSQDECPERLAAAHGLCKINPDIKETNHHEDDRRNFLSTSAVAALACGASLTAHAAGSTDENSLNFITDIFKDSTQPGEIEEATAITAEKNAEWYEKAGVCQRRTRLAGQCGRQDHRW